MKIKRIMMIVLSVVTICVYGCFSYAKGWTDERGEWQYIDNDGSLLTEVIKASEGMKYYLDEEGFMVRDYLLEGYNEAIYYFNDEGQMVSNTWVAVDPSQISDPIEDGPTVYLYYFGANGKAYKANDGVVRKTIDGKKYLFDEQGRMLSGWINESGEMFSSQDVNEDPFRDEYVYYAGDETDGVLREGWYEYIDGSMSDDYYDKESIWFYFNPTNNRKTRYDGTNNRGTWKKEYTTKKINGHNYAFDINGVMLVGWEAEPATKYYAENKLVEGQMVKKEWIFTIPPKDLSNNTDHEDEVERWFYASKSGDMTKSIVKKINGKDYVFDNNGIMKSGLVILNRSTKKFVAVIDVEETDGKEFLVDRKYTNKDTEKIETFNKETQILYYFKDDEWESDYGAKKTGEIRLAFGDKDYQFVSEKNGEREGLKNKEKKYYQHGLRLLPDALIGYGLVLEGYASPSTIDPTDVQAQRVYEQIRDVKFHSTDANVQAVVSSYDNNEYYITDNIDSYGLTGDIWTPYLKVVGNDGKKINKSNVAKKDKNGNYWIIGNDGVFVKIVSVPIKYSKNLGWCYRSEMLKGDSSKAKTEYIPFGTSDTYGRTVKMTKQLTGGYDVELDEQYALNFNWIE